MRCDGTAGTGRNGMEWDAMRCDATERNGTGSDAMRCDAMRWDEVSRTGWDGAGKLGRGGMGRAETGRGGGVVRDMMGLDETG